MTDRSLHRISGFAYVSCAAALFYFGERTLSDAHVTTPFVTGWILAAAISLLMLLGARKKISFLPVGSTSVWVQIHIYVGLVSGLLYLIHTGCRLPTGVPEQLLALAFLGVFASGVVGLILSRAIPPLLTSRGEEVLFERIPIHIRKLRLEAESLVDGADESDSDNPFLPAYAEHLQPFLSKPTNQLSHLMQVGGERLRLTRHLRSLRLTLSEDHEASLDRLIEIVNSKDDLDYHYAHQGVLKLWLFCHIPLTLALLVFVVLHAVLVHTFAG